MDVQSVSQWAAALDRVSPLWWVSADVMDGRYSEAQVALILDRRIYDRQAMPRPFPDEEDMLRDDLRGLA